jgi:hypothetical protein
MVAFIERNIDINSPIGINIVSTIYIEIECKKSRGVSLKILFITYSKSSKNITETYRTNITPIAPRLVVLLMNLSIF